MVAFVYTLFLLTFVKAVVSAAVPLLLLPSAKLERRSIMLSSTARTFTLIG